MGHATPNGARDEREKLKLGKIGYLNVLPIYYPLESGAVSHSFEIISGSPSQLNAMMASGMLDISAVSSIEVAYHPNRYCVLPDLGISCRGPVQSVLLMSRRPIHQLNHSPVLLTAQSATSIALLKILLAEYMGVTSPDFRHGSVTKALYSETPPTAFLAIGDEALKWSSHPLYPYQMDLGQAWHRWTGLPFVFGLWVVAKESIKKNPLVVQQAMEQLITAKTWGQENRDIIWRIAHGRGVLSLDAIRSYYEHLSFDFGPDEQQGLQVFFRMLYDLNEISMLPKIELFAPLAQVA